MIASGFLNLITLIAQRNSKNSLLMDISQTLQRMQQAASNALDLLHSQQEIENQRIEVQLDNLDPNTSDYTQQYQELLTEQQKLTQQQAKETQRLEEEWKRKEDPYERLQEQVQTEVEAIEADIDGTREVVQQNASTEFSMLAS